MEKLPEDFKQRWIAALRSGEYKQGDGFLHNPNDGTYCCLGVACRAAGHEPETDDDMEYPSTKLGNLPAMLKGSNPITRQLAQMNDGVGDYVGKRRSFSEIADHIEKYL